MADLQAAAVDAATAAGVDPDFFTSLIANGEKGFNNPGAVSPAGAYAPAGLMPGTARDLGVDPTDPIQNLQGGARYAKQMLDRYGGDQTLAAAAYNAGPGAVDRHGGVPPYRETQAYVSRVVGGLGSGGAPEPSEAALDAAFKASQAGGSGQPSSPSTASPGGPPAPPSGSGGGSGGYALPPGSLQVNAQHDGSVVDPATGTRYTPDPDKGDGFYRDPQNNSFQIAEPTQDDLDAAFKAQGGGSPDPAAIQGPPTSILGQFARGATDSLVSGANQIENFASPALGMLKQFEDSTDYLGGLIKTGLNGSPPPRLPIAPLMADASGQGFKFNDTSAIDPWLNQRPSNAAQDWARTAGAMAPIALMPGGGGLLPRALMVAGATVGDETGKGVGGLLGASPEATQLLQLGGSLLGGGAGHGVGEGGGLIASGARTAIDPFMARYSTKAAETQAGRVLAANATDLPAVRANLANGPDVTVPGSMPTTFQQTGDMGLGALERGVATKSPDPFQQRSADQNAARVDALSGMQTGADPMALQSHIRGQLDALDQATQAHIDDLSNTARGNVQALGGNLTPEAYGEQIRGIVSAAEQGERARESGLWNAVDPNGDLTGNVAATSKAATDIAGSLPSTAKPMQGEEAGIFNAAQNLPAVAPVQDLIALRSRLSTEMRNEVIANGRSPAFARMSQLRGAIQDNLAGTISDAVQRDNAKVASGAMSPDDGMAARVNAYFSDLQSAARSAPQAGRVSVGQSGGGSPGRGAGGVSGPNGRTFQVGGRPGSLTGNQGLSPGADLGSALDDINLARRGQTGGLFRQMQELGGVRLRYPDGSSVPGPDISDALSGNRTPGLVNNQSGLSPEMMAQALHDRGFFGPHETDPSAAFENAVAAHARGDQQFPTQAYDPGASGRIRQINREADAAGVVGSDRPAVAAAKLADYRAAVSDLTSRAISYGIDPAQHDDLESLYYQVGDHEASHPPRPAPEDVYGAEFDRLSAPSPIRPTFDQGAAGRLAMATEATKARAARFGQQPVSSITASSGGAGQYRLPDGRVPGRFFHPGPTGYGDVQSLLKASPEAAPVIQDYAASTARRAALVP